MQQQLGILGTISAFTFRHRETKKNLCRGGRSLDLPDTDLQPAIRQLKYVTIQQLKYAFIFQTSNMSTEHFRFIFRIFQVETWRSVFLRISVIFFSPSSPMPGTQIRPWLLPYRSLLICYALITDPLTLHSMC